MFKTNKKGMSDAVMWVIKILILVGVIAAVHFIKVTALNSALQTYDTEFYIENMKMMYSPEKLAYQSLTTGRTQPGIIDLEKFTDENLNKSSGKKVPMNITLTQMDGKVIKTIYQEKETYERLYPLTFDERKYSVLEKTYYVLVMDKGSINPGILNISMVVSR
jgi:hypothetical protein